MECQGVLKLARKLPDGSRVLILAGSARFWKDFESWVIFTIYRDKITDTNNFRTKMRIKESLLKLVNRVKIHFGWFHGGIDV